MLTDNFSLFNLFLDKKIKIYIDNNSFFHLRVPTIREFYLRDEINGIYHLITKPAKELKKIIPIQANIENSLDFVEAVLFQLAIYKEYHDITKNIKEVLQFFIPELEFDYQIKKIKIKNIIITSEI